MRNQFPSAAAPLPPGPVELSDLPGERWIGIGQANPLSEVVNRRLRETGQADRTPAIEVRTYYRRGRWWSMGSAACWWTSSPPLLGEGAMLHLITAPLAVGVFALFADGARGLQAAKLFADSIRAKFDDR